MEETENLLRWVQSTQSQSVEGKGLFGTEAPHFDMRLAHVCEAFPHS